jgi:uncharacterized protein (TIRG00374 family)
VSDGDLGGRPEHPDPPDDDALERLVLPEDSEVIVEGVAGAAGPGAAITAPAHLVGGEQRRKSPLRRTIEFVISFGIVALLFVLAIPAVSGSSYGDIWEQFAQLDGAEIVVLTTFWLISMWFYGGFFSACLPGLTKLQGMTLNFAGSAVSNVVPFGGALGIGATYAMSMTWGFRITAITRSIVVTGFWNLFGKLGVPVLVLVALTAAGRADGELAIGAFVGLAVLIVAVTLFIMVLRSERLAGAIGGIAERIARPVLRLARRQPEEGSIRAAVLDFRSDSVELVSRRWLRITWWMVLYTLGQGLLLWLCVLTLDAGTDQLGWLEVLAAFSFGRLWSAIPLTPSGVGFQETGLTLGLVAFGATGQEAAAATLLYSAFTYLLEIPLGGVGWGAWALIKGWRRPLDSVADDGTIAEPVSA